MKHHEGDSTIPLTVISGDHTYIYLASKVMRNWRAVLGKGSELGNGPNPEYPP